MDENGTLTNLLPTVLAPVRSVQCRVYRGLKWLSSGRSGSGKILGKTELSVDLKNTGEKKKKKNTHFKIYSKSGVI